MGSVPQFRLAATGVWADFSGGELTSDAGCLLLAETAERLGVRGALAGELAAHPLRTYDDCDLALQRAVLVACGYAAESDADELRGDPALPLACGPIASQETMSRRMSAMGEPDVEAMRRALERVEAAGARLRGPAEAVVVDVDTTLLPTFGLQEGSCFNFHYSDVGYHPVLATVTAERSVAGFELRQGSRYCSKGSGAFAGRVLDRQAAAHPGAPLALRADAGFAAPEVYEACEERGAFYAVRLKENPRLRAMCASAAECLEPGVPKAARGWFTYAADSWGRGRRVCFEVEMRAGELLPRYMFVVTNILTWQPSRVLEFYRLRGEMEQVVGDLKGFLRGLTPSRSMAANEFACLVGVLAYSLVNWTRLLALRGDLARARAATVVARVVKVAARRVDHAGRTVFKMPSSCPRKRQIYEAAKALAA